MGLGNIIIQEDDSRYYHLDNLFGYDYEKLIRQGTINFVYYFIPFELVLNNYITKGIEVLNTYSTSINCNWVCKAHFSRILKSTCNLGAQDYYDLLKLKINDRDDRPRCINCQKEVNLKNLLYGYRAYCSYHCKAYYQMTNPGLHNSKNSFTVLNSDYKFHTKCDMYSFISRGSADDECYLYLAELESGFKYGITIDLRKRILLSGFDIPYLSIGSLFVGNRLEVSYLEAMIKLEFRGREFLKNSELKLFLKKFNLLKSSIRNPFES